MAATAHPKATQAALSLLESGGSAMDAALAANAVLSVVEPMMCGPGGDVMAMVWSEAEHKLHGYNGAGRSPKSLTWEKLQGLLEGDWLPAGGPLSVTVPGAVKGWCDLHRGFGKVSMAEVLAPAIEVAEQGFPVTPVIADIWKLDVSEDDVTSGGAYPNATAGFFQIYGKADDAGATRMPKVGEVMRNEAMANTFRRLSEPSGCDDFYAEGGTLAKSIEAARQVSGLLIDTQDVVEHHGEWVEPVSVTYRDDYEVFQLPPNPQGVAALQMLNMLENYNLSAMGFNSAEYLHVHAEVKKLAFADASAFYGDPDFNQDIYPDIVASLLSKAYAKERIQEIDENAKNVVDPGEPAGAREGSPFSMEELAGADTTYITAADADGNMVSLIQSVFMHFGSGIVLPDLGFALQNRGSLFNKKRNHPNAYAPGKRPFQTIMPGFIKKHGEPFMAFGVMGGFMQPQGQVQIVCNMVDFGFGIQEAGDVARYFHDGSTSPRGDFVMSDGGVLQLEEECKATVENLRSRGHQVAAAPNRGGYQAILRDTSLNPGVFTYFGATEKRKDGVALGL